MALGLYVGPFDPRIGVYFWTLILPGVFICSLILDMGTKIKHGLAYFAGCADFRTMAGIIIARYGLLHRRAIGAHPGDYEHR